MITIGIDTGGTCTDSVIYNTESKEILASGKTLTTKDNLEIGIGNVLDMLPAELLRKAQMLCLSTTLATNACVENRGCRAKLLIIGTTPDIISRLKDVLSGYGIDDISQFVVLDAKAENMFSNPYDPDWDDLEKRVPELFSDCESVGVVQTFPNANGGRFELTALRVLKKQLTIPLTVAYDICKETDFLKICASTLLNARLIPLITEFIQAVHHVMENHGLNIPLSIVRSDGTLMSEEMALTCPVETLLCGPASSIIGAIRLTDARDGIVVDMGGTTTDLAMVRDNEPLPAKLGIHIGQYRTSMKGLDAKAIFLGGDSAIRFEKDQLTLGVNKIIPVSILAETYESVLPDLKAFVASNIRHTRNIHEFMVLQKGLSQHAIMTEYEQKAVNLLAKKPLLIQEFAAKMGTDVYNLKTERLEQEGYLIRSGLTPTDMMVIRGDLHIYRKEAAEELIKYASFMTGRSSEVIPDIAFELVVKKLYKTIALFMLEQQYPKNKFYTSKEEADFLLESYYEQARLRLEAPADYCRLFAQTALTSPMPLIGVGAPTHVFLPRVAELMGTCAIHPEYAHIANAVGAAACSHISRIDLIIKLNYDGGFECSDYSYVSNQERHVFKERQDAIDAARKDITEAIKKRAEFQGLGSNPLIEITIEERRLGDKTAGVLAEIILHAVARGHWA